MKNSGWSNDEERLLRELAAAAEKSGGSLSGVFREAAGLMGRKPDSVRNHYYALLRESGGRAAAYVPFTEAETRRLLTHILSRRSEGCSVRKAALELANGDVSLMLRYQNKYRSLVAKRPDLVREAAASCGVPSPSEERKRERLGSADRKELLRLLDAKNAELKKQHERFMLLHAMFTKLCELDRGLVRQLAAKGEAVELRKLIDRISSGIE